MNAEEEKMQRRKIRMAALDALQKAIDNAEAFYRAHYSMTSIHSQLFKRIRTELWKELTT